MLTRCSRLLRFRLYIACRSKPSAISDFVLNLSGFGFENGPYLGIQFDKGKFENHLSFNVVLAILNGKNQPLRICAAEIDRHKSPIGSRDGYEFAVNFSPGELSYGIELKRTRT